MRILVMICHQSILGLLYLVKAVLIPKYYTQGEAHTFHASSHFFDVYILVVMLSIPWLVVEAAQAFERALARGAFVPESVAVALERRALNFTPQYVTENFQQANAVMEEEAIQRDDFNSILGLAETLALSGNSRVKGFVKVLYTMLFKRCADESQRLRLLKRLVDRATTTADASRDVDLDVEILAIIVCEEQETVRPVLNMMREVVELANIDRGALWHQLCTSEKDILRIREERKAEIASSSKEIAVLSQRITESVATHSRLKSEMRAEADRFTRERKELTEQMHEVENQLERVHSEKDDEITGLVTEKKVLQDRLYDAESQLSQLKSRKRDELKGIAERLKNAEAARKRFDEELKRHASENVSREQKRQALEDGVRRLTQTVGQNEEAKREKVDQVARCEAYIDGMEPKLQACQQYIHHLEGQLQEEMSRHAPLYGAGLEALSMKELETIARIHEEGLRRIHAIQHRKGGPMAVGLPPPLIPNGNGHVNGPTWFN